MALYENSVHVGKKIVGHSKLIFFWDHGEQECPVISAHSTMAQRPSFTK